MPDHSGQSAVSIGHHHHVVVLKRRLFQYLRRNFKSLAAVLALYWLLDYLYYVRRVRLHFGDRSKTLDRRENESAHRRLVNIVARCPSLSKIYWPPWFAPDAMMQVFLLCIKELRCRFLQRSPYTREMLRLRDGATISLDWVVPETTPAAQHLPVCVLLHGAFQDSSSVTMIDLSRELASHSLPVVVMNRRGYGNVTLDPDVPLKLAFFGSDEDLDDVLEHVARKQPGRLVSIIGFSAGSGFAARYAGKRACSSVWSRGRIGGASAFGNLGSAGSVSASEGHTSARTLDGRLVPCLLSAVAYDPGYDHDYQGGPMHVRFPWSWGCNFCLKYYYVFQHREELRKLKKSESWSQLVGEMLSPKTDLVGTMRLQRKMMGNFKDSSSWLSEQGVKVKEIDIPSLFINSRDDPICRWINVERNFNEMKGNPHLVLAELQRGSHGCKFDFWGWNNVAHSMISQFVLSTVEEYNNMMSQGQ